MDRRLAVVAFPVDDGLKGVLELSLAAAAVQGHRTLEPVHVVHGAVLAALDCGEVDATRGTAFLREMEQTLLTAYGRLTPVATDQVEVGRSIGRVFSLSLDLDDADRLVSTNELLRTMSVLPGLHQRFAPAALALLDGLPPEPPRRRSLGRRAVSAYGSFLALVGVGASMVFFGAGVILLRSWLYLVAAGTRLRVELDPWWDDPASSPRYVSVPTRRQHVLLTVAARVALFAVSVCAFVAVFLRVRGIGSSLNPAVTNGSVALTGDEIDTEARVGAALFTSDDWFPLWLALGAGAAALPSLPDLVTLREWPKLRSGRVTTQRASVLRVVDRCLRAVETSLDWLGAFAFIVTGAVSASAAGLVGLLIANALAG